MTKAIKGLSIHCHHDILVEYCYDYKERVKYIKNEKPKEEIKTRLRLFKILPEKALKDVPKYYQKADVEWSQEQKDALHKMLRIVRGTAKN